MTEDDISFPSNKILQLLWPLWWPKTLFDSLLFYALYLFFTDCRQSYQYKFVVFNLEIWILFERFWFFVAWINCDIGIDSEIQINHTILQRSMVSRLYLARLWRKRVQYNWMNRIAIHLSFIFTLSGSMSLTCFVCMAKFA